MKNFSLEQPQTIWRHQTNNSTSKQSYLFSKTQRFPQPNPECKIAFYANNSELSKRKTSFGFGNKSDFTKTLTCSPRASKYEFQSVFDKSRSRGRSFGIGRDSSPDRSYFIPQIHKFPGPGKYERQTDKFPKVSYSMRSKGSDFGGDHLGYNLNPGPGSYDDLNLEPKSGKFKVSKFTDSKLGIVNKAPRFENEKETPGPLSYSELDNLTGNGKYVLSKRKGSGTRKFDIEGRKTFTDKFREDSTKVPGPGNYEKPSDFGVYGDSKYYKTLRSEA